MVYNEKARPDNKPGSKRGPICLIILRHRSKTSGRRTTQLPAKIIILVHAGPIPASWILRTGTQNKPHAIAARSNPSVGIEFFRLDVVIGVI